MVLWPHAEFLRGPGSTDGLGLACREFGLDTKPPSVAADLSGNLVTTMQAGAVAGALLSSPFADRWGRKPGLLAVAITGLVGGLLQAFSYGHLPAFYIGR